MDIEIPTVDLSQYLKTGDDEAAAKQVANAMAEFGVLILRDPRVDPGLPVRYREMMERFYRLPPEIKSKYVQGILSDGTQIYETGWRPPFTEKPRRRDEVLHLIPQDAMPKDPPQADPKERFMRPHGPRPDASRYPQIDYLPLLEPVEIEDWTPLCNAWGNTMSDCTKSVLELLALGCGERPDLFTSLMACGIQKLAPTGLDLSKHGAPGTVAAGFHNDLSAVTTHGRSNFPGLWAWTRGWKKFQVRLPDDSCLLLQGGRALEHLTAGYTLRGYHEVVIGEEAVPKIREQIASGIVPWRVSTTMFTNTGTGCMIEPVGKFANEPGAERYFNERFECGARMMKTLTDKVVKPAA